MLLACDIGNTNIKTGLFSGEKLVERMLFASIEEAAEYLKKIYINRIAISSVVPEKTASLKDIINDLYDISPYIINSDSLFNLGIDYSSPETLGIDRICSAEGAFHLYKSSDDFNKYYEGTYLLSVDFGTATTINVIAHPGKFIGGIIAPGVGLMFGSLNKNTAQLPDVSTDKYNGLLGTNTVSSIASGVINSTSGLINNTINYLKREKNASVIKIFITGGNADKIIPYLDFEFSVVSELVLIGVKTIYEKNFPG